MPNFIESKPRTESIFRSIILFGRNVASYKFALGKSLLELSDQEKTFVSMEELAVPFSHHISEHLKINDNQCTSSSSKFLDQIREYNIGKCSHDNLVETTVSLGFNNVIDAFHIVGKGEVPERFFIDERKERKGIIVTDSLLKLKEKIQFTNFQHEVEARWRLVETAWSLQINPQLLEVRFDSDSNELYTEFNDFKRITITSCRDSLNGYQKGHCFYCHKDIVVDGSVPEFLADVDHFFPHVLAPEIPDVNINGVWNLVLACTECNHGAGGKFENIPTIDLMERLHTRNEYLISSHHPLRETIINQTGSTTEKRIKFLQTMDQRSIDLISNRWAPKEMYDTEI
ncbi:MAG: 5-methylcytosine-specific restriction endonuclease McrA [Desulforhopalus sp.]|jgi:5-methylcytosine-specific restriction endonuclease McrA